MMEPVAAIGKYKILEEISRGGLSPVYKTADTTFDCRVTLNVLDNYEHYHLLSKL